MSGITYEGVERMRAAVRRLLQPQMMPGTIYMSDECGPDFFPSPQYIESVLQSYIMAGIGPVELEAAASVRDTLFAERVRRHQQ